MLYSIKKAAEILNFHPKTLLRFIHEGKIKATKAGGQWRILEEDLKMFSGDVNYKDIDQKAVLDESKEEKKEKITVSSIIDIFVENKDEALRLSNTIMAVMNNKDPEYGSARCDYIFFEDELKARFIVWGSPLFISQLLKCISVISK